MEQQLNNYEFINSETGNIIAYLSLPATLIGHELKAMLDRRKAELAVNYRLFIERIYWQQHDHCIR